MTISFRNCLKNGNGNGNGKGKGNGKRRCRSLRDRNQSQRRKAGPDNVCMGEVLRGRRNASRGDALEEEVVEVAEEEAGDEGEEAGGYVVEHDARAGGEGLEAADGPGFEDVEEPEEEEG